MYEEISANKRNSIILVVLFIILISGLGYVLGLYMGNIYIGFFFAGIFSVVYTIIMFFSGDKMILTLSRARPVRKQDYPHLYHTVEGLAIAAGIPKPKLYIIDDTAINAFATGRDPDHAAITVTKGCADKLNRAELEGVIAHEMSHIRNYDIRLMMLTVAMVGIAVLLSDFILRSFLWGGGRRRRDSGGSAGAILIVLGLVLAILTPLFAQLMKLAISRRREYLADASAALLTRYPPGLAGALKKIRDDKEPLVEAANNATAHLFISNPLKDKKGKIRNLFSTHPDINDRIRRLEKM